MTEITPEAVYKLFVYLRSSDPVENQTASNQLQAISTNQETVSVLFHLLETVQDVTIRCHIYYTLTLCLKNVLSKADNDSLIICRQAILQLIQNETDIRCINSIMSVIRTLYLESAKPNRPDWTDLIGFLLSIDLSQSSNNLYIVLSLFRFLFHYLPFEIIQQNFKVFQALILTGLQVDEANTAIQSESVLFLFKLFKKIKKMTPESIPDYSVFSPILLNLFFSQFEKSDTRIFKIVHGILNGIDNEIFIFPFEAAFPKILEMLQSDAIEIDIRTLVHSFAFLCLKSPTYSALLSKDICANLFQFELYMTNLIISNQKDDMDIIDFEDIFNALRVILENMPEIDIPSFVIENGQEIQNTLGPTNPASVTGCCFVLVLFVSAISLDSDFTNEQIELMFAAFIQALTSDVPLIAQISMKYLSLTTVFFQNQFNAAKVDFMNILEALLQGPFCERPLTLLNEFVCILDDSDPIFDRLWAICTQLTNDTHELVQILGYQTMAETIKHSHVIVIEKFDEIYQQIMQVGSQTALISDNPHSFVVSSLCSLISVAPGQCVPYLNEFLGSVFVALTVSTNEYVSQNLLSLVQDVYNTHILLSAVDIQLTKNVIDLLTQKVNQNWTEKILNTLSEDYIAFNTVIEEFRSASQCLYILSLLGFELEHSSMITFVFATTAQFIQVFVEFQDIDFLKFQSILDSVYHHLCDNEFSLLIKRRDTLPSALAELEGVENSEVLKKQATEKIAMMESIVPNLVQISSSLLNIFEYVNKEDILVSILKLLACLIRVDVIDKEVYPKIIELILTKPSTQQIMLCLGSIIANMCDNDVPFDSLLPLFFQGIHDMLFSKDDHLLVLGLSFISKIGLNSIPFLFLPDIAPMTMEIPAMIENPESDNKVLTQIMNIFISFAKTPMHDKVPLDPAFSTAMLVAAKNRLVAELSSENASLTDILAVLIADFGSYVMGDDFPFNEVIPILVSAIPLSPETENAGDVYQLLAVVFPHHSTDKDITDQYVVKIIDLLSRPYSDLTKSNLNCLLLNSILRSLEQSLEPNIPDEEARKSEFLQNVAAIAGEEKFALFLQTYTNISEEYNACIKGAIESM